MSFVFVFYCRPIEKNLTLLQHISNTYDLTIINPSDEISEICKLNPKISKLISRCKKEKRPIPNKIMDEIFLSNYWKFKLGNGVILLNYPQNNSQLNTLSNLLSNDFKKINLIVDIENDSNIMYKTINNLEINNNLNNSFYNRYLNSKQLIDDYYNDIMYFLNGYTDDKSLFNAICNIIEINTSLKRTETMIYSLIKKSLI